MMVFVKPDNMIKSMSKSLSAKQVGLLVRMSQCVSLTQITLIIAQISSISAVSTCESIPYGNTVSAGDRFKKLIWWSYRLIYVHILRHKG